jgi:hypothetical protein
MKLLLPLVLLGSAVVYGLSAMPARYICVANLDFDLRLFRGNNRVCISALMLLLMIYQIRLVLGKETLQAAFNRMVLPRRRTACFSLRPSFPSKTTATPAVAAAFTATHGTATIQQSPCLMILGEDSLTS